MEQLITTAAVISVLGGVLIFLLKHQFGEITDGIQGTRKEIQDTKEKIQTSNDELEEKLKNQIQKSNDRVNERIDRMEQKNEKEISAIKEDIVNIKGDFSMAFVLREDFFRSMNGMEDNIRDISHKMDRILILSSEQGKRGE